MVDFSLLLNKKASEAKAPPLLPVSSYAGVITQWEARDDNKNNTPYIRFHLGLTAWPDEVESEEREGIDLSKRKMRKDFYLTDEADYILTEMLTSLGIDTDRAFSEILPETIGKPVLLSIKQGMNQQTNRFYNTVDSISSND